MEKIALEIAVDLDMPSLGICRGLQFFNAYWGGSLWRDLNISPFIPWKFLLN